MTIAEARDRVHRAKGKGGAERMAAQLALWRALVEELESRADKADCASEVWHAIVRVLGDPDLKEDAK